MYLLQLYFDHLEPNSHSAQVPLAQHSIIYVDAGELTVNNTKLGPGNATYIEDYASISTDAALKECTVLWRWVITSEVQHPIVLLTGRGIASTLRMSRKVKMFEMVPASKWIFRLDCIVEMEGCTGQHSHPGSGIRCMIKGYLRAESEKGEDSTNKEHGDTWYEEGAYPLVSTNDIPNVKTTFLRGMVLPPEYYNYEDTAIFIEGSHRVKKKAWKNYEQRVIVLR